MDKKDKPVHSHDDLDEEFFEDDEDIVLTLTDEEGGEHDFFLLAELEIEDNLYRVVMAADAESEEEADEVIIFKVISDEDGEELMVDIENDEEWEMVADVWQELVEEEGI